MSWSRNNSLRHAFCAWLLAALLLGIPGSVAAQGGFDQRYQSAMDLYTGTKMEDACEAFKVLNKENPGDKQTQLYLKISCDTVKKLQKNEEDLFNQGVTLYTQNQLDDARQKFKQSGSSGGLKNHLYRDKALEYVKKIEDKVAQKEAAQREAAQKEAAQKEAAQKEAAQREAAQKEAARKEAAKKEPAKPPREKQVATGTPTKPANKPSEQPAGQPTATDDTLRAGLKAYFDGDLQAAQRDLKDYIEHNGQKKGLAYFFRGAAHSTLYFLSGEKDSGEKSQAVADFQAAKSSGQGFLPPSEKYVSPKILDIYNQTPGQ